MSETTVSTSADLSLPKTWTYPFFGIIVVSLLIVGKYALDHSEENAAFFAYHDKVKQEKLEAMAAASGGTSSSDGSDAVELPVRFTNDAALATGEKIFKQLCFSCHLMDGGGAVGPNLADDYFIHGPTYWDSVRIITEGVPEKGMVTWRGQLTEEQIEAVASYIWTFRGTSPAVSKEPQGKQYPEEVWELDPSELNKEEEHVPPAIADVGEQSTEEAVLEKGAVVYATHCYPCHAADGGGLVAPNLTDEFYLHGATYKDAVAVVVEGVNGTHAYKDRLDAEEVQAVVSYIMTLKGSTPAVPRAPEGDKVASN